MALITLSTTYATTGSAPKASCIGWINWGNFSLNPGDSDSVEVSLSNGFILTFDIENENLSGDAITFVSDTSIPNSSFGTLGYTGITEKIALEPFSSYIPSIYDSAKFKLSNILVKNPDAIPISGYSIILASIQLDDSSMVLETLYDQQTFSTDGTDWNRIAWLGNISSPQVNDSNKQNIILSTVSNISGSPVYSTNAPSNVSITVSSDTSLPQFAIGIAISSLTLNKVINGRFSTNDQFTLSITGPVSDSVTTEGTGNGLQNKLVNLNGPVDSFYTINETMSITSDSTLDLYTQLVTWVNNCPDGNPAPTTGYLGQEILVGVGDNFVATISNTPITTPAKTDPDSGPQSDTITWVQFHNMILTEGSSSFISMPLTTVLPSTLMASSLSPVLALEFIMTNHSNSIIKSSLISDSAFGSILYTGLTGQSCLEVTCYTENVTIVINNIKIIHPLDNIYYKYSMILSSVQYNDNAPTNYNVTQEFITNGAPWEELAWAGDITTSPTVQYYDNNRRVVITTTEAISGSPVFISDPPTSLTINLSGTLDPVTHYYKSRFVISTTIKKIPLPNRGINLFKNHKD